MARFNFGFNLGRHRGPAGSIARRMNQTGKSGSRSQGAIRAQRDQQELNKYRNIPGAHTERDKIPGYAGTTTGVYSRSRGGSSQSNSRSQGQRRRNSFQEDQPGFNPDTMGNRRSGIGATRPISRSNATRRVQTAGSAAAVRRRLQESGNYARRGRAY